MARVWTEGFEMQDTVGYTIQAGVVTTTSFKRSGAAGLDCLSSSYYLRKSITAISEGYLRFAGYWTNYNSGIKVAWKSAGGTELGSVRVNSGGYLEIYTGSSTLVATGTHQMVTDTWYMIEVHISIADSGTIETRVGGHADATFSGDTKPGADTTFGIIELVSSGSYHVYFDDCALNDTTGGADNSWCGDSKIIILMPDATEAQGLTGSDGNTTDNHLMVDEKPADGDTTYVYGSVVDTEDLYSFPACGLTSVTIKRVWAEARAKDAVAAGGKYALIIKPSGGSSDPSADITLTTNYTTNKDIGDVLTLNPADSAAWEVADIDAIQAGPRIRG